MKWIRQQVLSGELLTGTFLNLGSSLTVEIAGKSGLDWVLIDTEHGAGDFTELVHQLQAAESTPAAPIVRIAWNEVPRFKRVLDLGPSGVMVPYVNSVEEARQAVASMRYPPQGVRGVASFNRACGFGRGFAEYFATANENLLTVVQIETSQAVDQAQQIAAVEGVDVLFVGPMDLGVNMGTPRRFDDPEFCRALNQVVVACRQHGKSPGILLPSTERLEQVITEGFKFVALGSDGLAVSTLMSQWSGALGKYKQKQR
jgi:4-hydroxy-2-oxoheptanedioate aldolase